MLIISFILSLVIIHLSNEMLLDGSMVDGLMQICEPDRLTLETVYTRERAISTLEVIHTFS